MWFYILNYVYSLGLFSSGLKISYLCCDVSNSSIKFVAELQWLLSQSTNVHCQQLYRVGRYSRRILSFAKEAARSKQRRAIISNGKGFPGSCFLGQEKRQQKQASRTSNHSSPVFLSPFRLLSGKGEFALAERTACKDPKRAYKRRNFDVLTAEESFASHLHPCSKLGEALNHLTFKHTYVRVFPNKSTIIIPSKAWLFSYLAEFLL